MSAIQSLGFPTEGLDLTLRPIPLEGEWGFGSAVAFQLRRVGATGNPKEIAEQVVAAVPSLPQLQRVEAVNGYVNFYVDKDWYANRVVGQVLSQGREYGCWPSKGERVMVEYANLNTHKTMHVGHLRNVVLGQRRLQHPQVRGLRHGGCDLHRRHRYARHAHPVGLPQLLQRARACRE